MLPVGCTPQVSMSTFSPIKAALQFLNPWVLAAPTHASERQLEPDVARTVMVRFQMFSKMMYVLSRWRGVRRNYFITVTTSSDAALVAIAWQSQVGELEEPEQEREGPGSPGRPHLGDPRKLRRWNRLALTPRQSPARDVQLVSQWLSPGVGGDRGSRRHVPSREEARAGGAPLPRCALTVRSSPGPRRASLRPLGKSGRWSTRALCPRTGLELHRGTARNFRRNRKNTPEAG